MSRLSTPLVALLLAPLLGACKPIPPEPLAQRAFAAASLCDGFVRVAPAQAAGLILHAAPARTISPEAQAVPLFEMISVSTTSGGLVYSDLVHDPDARQTYEHCKLDLDGLRFHGVAGQIGGPARLFTPDRDVLRSLDVGFGAEVRLGELADAVVFRPDYRATAYAPFDREAPDKPQARTGAGGRSGGVAPAGARGANGDPGQDGGDGRPGADAAEPGVSGGAGGAGGAGGVGCVGAAWLAGA